MEQMMKCPLCGTENKRTYYSEDVGLVEDHYACKHCGYTEEMAYSPRYGGIDTSLADDGVWPSPERMWELAQAKKDGRLVVLPCKVGDTVYRLQYIEQGPGRYVVGVAEIKFALIWLEEIGKTVFLTHEEAEAALQKGGTHETDPV